MNQKNNTLFHLFYGFIFVSIISSCASPDKGLMNNMIARMEVKEPIPGVCDNANVIAILPISGNGQVEAICPKTDKEIEQELNVKVKFLADNSDYEGKGMVSLIVNCKGEMVRCEIDNKTKSPELDAQIVAVFAELTSWTTAKINNHPVDTVVLYSFTIKNGKITIS